MVVVVAVAGRGMRRAQGQMSVVGVVVVGVEGRRRRGGRGWGATGGTPDGAQLPRQRQQRGTEVRWEASFRVLLLLLVAAGEEALLGGVRQRCRWDGGPGHSAWTGQVSVLGALEVFVVVLRATASSLPAVGSCWLTKGFSARGPKTEIK
jgi:hypothetical protein